MAWSIQRIDSYSRIELALLSGKSKPPISIFMSCKLNKNAWQKALRARSEKFMRKKIAKSRLFLIYFY